MSWPTGRSRGAPPVDWLALIENLLTHHAPQGSRCRACGRLPDGMTPVRHQATAVHNRLVQAGAVSVHDRASLGQDGVQQPVDLP